MAYSISKEAQQLLCEIINQISITERKAEQLRIQLCRRSTFNPYASFKKLDSFNKNQVSPLQIIQFLKENNVIVSDCNLFLQQLFHKEYLTYQDFLIIILPRTDNELREITVMKQPNKCSIEKNIEQNLSQLFILEQNEAQNLERLKIRLSKYYTPEQMFKSIDSLDNNQLTFKDFDRFFRRNGLLIYEEELFAFFYRIDNNRTGQIKLNDFKDLLQIYIQENNNKIEESILQQQQQQQQQENQQIQQVQQYLTPKQQNYLENKTNYQNKLRQSTQTTTKKTNNNENIQIDENRNSQIGQIIQLRSNSTCKSQKCRYFKSSSICDSISSSTKLSEFIQNDDQKFIDLSLEILKLEMYLEEIKLKLQQQKEFNSMDFFHFMDIKNQGKINQYQFTQFLQQFKFKELNIINLFQFLDKDQDGYIRYSDISEFISPINMNSIYLLKKPMKNNNNNNINQLFSKITIKFIQLLFNQWNENEKIISIKKQQLLKNIDILYLFKKIDTFNKGKINKQDLQRYFEKHDIQDDIKLLYKKIANNHKEITFKQFEQFTLYL